MSFDLQDTIVAPSTAPGSGARAVIRLSGPDALRLALVVFSGTEPVRPQPRRIYPGLLRPRSDFPAFSGELYVLPAPRTYTGQQMAELHLISSMPLVECTLTSLLNAGARAARPGEFTLRAFLGGKLDLTKAEAVHDVISAEDPESVRQALATLAGGVSQPLRALRSDLLDLLADLEAGLDFLEEDISFVSTEDQVLRLGRFLATLALLRKQLQGRSTTPKPFRVVLVGKPNAGKSRLFNALTGAQALVSPEAGTTRDYLVSRIELSGVPIELVDTAGWQESEGLISTQAQALGREQSQQADLILVCQEAGSAPVTTPPTQSIPALLITTKCDLGFPTQGLATSALSGAGLSELRERLLEHARARTAPTTAPSASRCQHHITTCETHLQHAHQMVLFEEPTELVALEVRAALDELGALVGAVYTDDLLDRIFSRFCIGK